MHSLLHITLVIFAGLAVITPLLLLFTAPRIPKCPSNPIDPSDKEMIRRIEDWRNGK